MKIKKLLVALFLAIVIICDPHAETTQLTREINTFHNESSHDVRAALTMENYPTCGAPRTADLTIMIDKRKLFVPKSAFIDLVNIQTVNISQKDKGYILIITGGDASDSYLAKIYFDIKRVYRRTIESAILPDEMTEDTEYFERVM